VAISEAYCRKGLKILFTTAGKEELSQAEDAAEEWFLELRGKFERGELGELEAVNGEKTFRDAAEQFLREFEVITQGERSPIYVADHHRRLRKYLIPFFGDLPLSKVTSGKVQEYRIQRIEQAKADAEAKKAAAPSASEKAKLKLPARSTIHQEIVALRQTLKTALSHGWLSQ
jgi:hypothetical protein